MFVAREGTQEWKNKNKNEKREEMLRVCLFLFFHFFLKKLKKWYILDLCVSSLRRGHANLLCIVPILADDLFRGSARIICNIIYPTKWKIQKTLWVHSKNLQKNQYPWRDLNPQSSDS